MKIVFNQQEIKVPAKSILKTILQSQKLPLLFAIAVNGKFVAKSYYESYELKPDDIVALLTPMQGG
jgi:thiamine biosynthesis protein ThiS